MNTWLLRALWVSLSITAGDAFASALDSWSDGPRLAATIALWLVWAMVLTALLVPRPIALTITRMASPNACAAAVLTAFASGPSAASVALADLATAGAALLAVRGEFARACAQGAAYGDEERFPLKVPPGIAFGIMPIAVPLAGVGAVAGPLLLADEQWVLGGFAVAVGWPIAVVIVRLVHQLSRRWVVLVPAGLVVADPLTLTDPVLFVRETIQGLGPADPSRPPGPDALDLRLGAAFGSTALLLHEEAHVMRRVRGEGVGVRAGLLLVTPVEADRLLHRAAARRIPVHRS